MIPRDILLHRPNNAGGPRLGGAAAEKLNAANPDSEDPIKLPASARGRPFEDDFGEVLRWAIRRRVVVGEDRRAAVGVGEVVAEEEIGARFGVGEWDGFGDFEVGGGRSVGSGGE